LVAGFAQQGGCFLIATATPIKRDDDAAIF
jgi:hypothetical protein